MKRYLGYIASTLIVLSGLAIIIVLASRAMNDEYKATLSCEKVSSDIFWHGGNEQQAFKQCMIDAGYARRFKD